MTGSPAYLDPNLITACARAWIGTPYVHGQSVKGAGTDCLGLVRGVWRELLGDEPELPPNYSPDWAEAGGNEDLMGAADRHLIQDNTLTAAAGRVLLFRWRADLPVKHCGIASGDGRMIHAYQNQAVTEVTVPPAWMRRLAATYSYPPLIITRTSAARTGRDCGPAGQAAPAEARAKRGIAVSEVN